MTVQHHTAVARLRSDPRAYTDEIEARQRRVRDLLAFLKSDHVSYDLLRAYLLRNDKRAHVAISTIGRVLGYPLAEQLDQVRDTLERSMPYDLAPFSQNVAPGLFDLVNRIAPRQPAEDLRTRVDQLQYSIELREALLTYILTLFNQRYQPPRRFDSVAQGSAWYAAYNRPVELSATVIQDSRKLLYEEMSAVREFLSQIESEIIEIESVATERLGVIERIRWRALLQDADTEINNLLAARSVRLENVTSSTPGTALRERPALAQVARRAARTAPRLGGLLALGIGGVIAARNADRLSDLSGASLANATQPQRSAQDTGAAPALRLDSGMASAQELRELTAAYTTQAARQNAAVAEGVQARSRVDEFFNRLPASTGRQSLTIQNESELQGFIARLTSYGYEESAILNLLGLSSTSAFSQPITLDLRRGQQLPILFPEATDAQVTARLAAIPQVRAVYLVQGGESIEALAQRFGTTVTDFAAANAALDLTQPLAAGSRLVVPGAATDSARVLGMGMSNGATLDQVAATVGSDAATLAALNGVQEAAEWRLQGGLLDVPAAALLGSQAAAPAATAALPAVQVAQQTAAQPATLGTGESYTVYRVQPGDTLDTIAARYGMATEQIMGDNSLTAPEVTSGQKLLIRRPPATQQAAPTPLAAAPLLVADQSASEGGAPLVAASVAGSPGLASRLGATLSSAWNALSDNQSNVKPLVVSSRAEQSLRGGATAPVAAAAVPSVAAVNRYGTQLFPSIEAMPEDARSYLLGTTQEVAAFFDVRPGDILGIMRQEQNGAGWRLQENRISSAGATGVGQIVARTWNGWANPQRLTYVSNVADIEEHGGLGFDWSKREAWRDWKYNGGDRSLLDGSNADPLIFENSVAAIARHLAHWGLTTDFAARDPQGFADRLADAIAVYNSGRTLDQSADFTQSAENRKTTADYVAAAMAVSEELRGVVGQPSVAVASPEAVATLRTSFRDLYDRSLGVTLSDNELDTLIARQGTILTAVREGKTESKSGALQLLAAVEQGFMNEGMAALRAGDQRPWPFVHNPETLYAQHMAVSLMGRTLTLYEMDDLMNRTQGDRDQIRIQLTGRADTRLYTQARYLYDQLLGRSENGKPVYTNEITSLLTPAMAGYSPVAMDDAAMRDVIAKFQGAVESLSEYRQLHGAIQFKAMPLSPMPALIRSFGVPINYQAGGKHTGIDIANPLVNGEEPEIYAVDDATVTYVGPLYCLAEDACRGGKAIVLDHGNNIYSIYSHNSQATVRAGDRVTAGQMIGRQGNEGYSFGAHLHFEVHIGAPFSGDWQNPFEGGEFADPMAFLPGGKR